MCVASISEWVMIFKHVKIQENCFMRYKHSSHACFDDVEVPAKVPLVIFKSLNTFVNLALNITACGKSRNNIGKRRLMVGHAV